MFMNSSQTKAEAQTFNKRINAKEVTVDTIMDRKERCLPPAQCWRYALFQPVILRISF